MAITIRNKAVEDTVRRIGRRTGLGPSAVVAKAVALLDASPPAAIPPEEVERRRTFAKAFVAEMAAKTTDEERRLAREIETGMYDENGLPR